MKKMTKILSALLVICMVFSLVPVVHTPSAEAASVYDGWLWPVPTNTNMSRAYASGHTGLDIKPSASGAADNVEVVAAKAGTVVLVFGGCSVWNGHGKSHKNCSNWATKYVNGKTYNQYINYKDTKGNYGYHMCNYGFGRGIIIDHGDGVISTYAHMNSTIVSPGQKVAQGDRIGYMGSYGNSTGKHLHFDIWENQWSWLGSTGDFYPDGAPINNNPHGNEYVINKGGAWNGIDTIYYSRNYHKHSFDAKTHVCTCGDWDPNSLKSVDNNSKGTVIVTKDGGAVKRSGPYESCKSYSVAKGTELSFVGKVINAADNLWYKLSDGNYIYYKNVEVKPEPAPSKLTLSASLSATEMTEYEGNKVVGNFSSNYNMTVTTYLDNVKKSSISVKSGAYTITASHAVNTGIDYSSIAAGSHKVKIVITDEGGGSKTVELPFTVTPIITKPAVSSVENFIGGKKVSLKCDTYDAKIYYTTDGSTPTQASEQYEGPFNVTESCTVKAISTNGTMIVSGVMSYLVTVSEAAIPEITYDYTHWGTRVTISTSQNAEIMYSVDNGVYSKYFEPFIISSNATVSAYARSAGCKDSQTVSESITVSAPEAPKFNAVASAKVAQNGTVTVSWNAVKNAASYTVTVTRNGEIWNSETVTSANASFVLDEAGIYSFTVVASNSIGSSEASEAVSIEAVSPRTVTFEDWDGSVIATQKVDYGSAATLPEDPSRTGYYFIGWIGNYSDVRSDITITANYRIKTFTVVFLNVDGSKIGDTQIVPYMSSAEPPVKDVKTETGKVFAGWSVRAESASSLCDVTRVDSNMTAQATLVWHDPELPVEAEIVSATRDDDNANGNYTMSVKLTNYEKDFTTALLRVELKTKEGKLVVTEGRTVGLKPGAVETFDFTLSTTDTATVAEAVVLGYEGGNLTGSAYSKAVTADVKVVSNYTYGEASKWDTVDPATYPGWSMKNGVLVNDKGEEVAVESKTQYSSRTKTTTTSTTDDLAGWTKYDTTVNYTEWVDKGWTTAKPTVSNTCKQTATKTVTDSAAYTQYVYYHWRVKVGSTTYYTYGPNYWRNQGYNPVYYTKTTTSPLTYSATYDGYKAYVQSGQAGLWWLSSTTNVPAKTHTEYRYSTRTAYNVYSYYKWSDWSVWQDAAISASDNTEVKTQTVYSYKVKNVPVLGDLSGTENTSGNFYTFSNVGAAVVDNDEYFYYVPGALPDASVINLAGKLATVMVYKGKNSDPNESQLQYVGQITIGDGNTFSVRFKPKAEPSSSSGDYVVALSLQGSTGLVNIGVIKAPGEKYTVTFYDADGNKLEDQQVEEGGNAKLPEAPAREGHSFVCWNESGTGIYRNTDVSPVYVPQTFAVAYVDWVNGVAVPLALTYGQKLADYAPTAPAAEGYEFLGWGIENAEGELVPVGEATVTGNVVVSAMYKANEYTVTFYDSDDEDKKAVSTQIVEHGKSAVLPDAPVYADKEFLGWSTDNAWWEVTGNMDVYALTVYKESTSEPIPSIDKEITGCEQELELEQKDGVTIYYTVDGTDPVPGFENITNEGDADGSYEGGVTYKYDGTPIRLDDSMVIKAIAVENKKNASDIIEVNFTYFEGSSYEEYDDLVTVGTYSPVVNPGDTVTLNININENPGLMGYMFFIECDPAVYYLDYDEETGLYACKEGDVASSGTYLAAPDENGWRVMWFDTGVAEGDGTLFSVTLNTASDAVPGVYPVTVKYSAGNMLTSEYEEAEVDCSAALSGTIVKGDANFDGDITMADVVLMARYIVGLYVEQNNNVLPKFLSACDLNYDGYVTTADLVRLSRFVAGLETALQ